MGIDSLNKIIVELAKEISELENLKNKDDRQKSDLESKKQQLQAHWQKLNEEERKKFEVFDFNKIRRTII